MNSKALGIAITLLVALLVGFAWWVYFAVAGKLHWAVPLALTLAPILIALAVWVWQRQSSRRSAGALERALAQQSDRDQQRVSGARRAEIERLRAEFERAVSALKGSKLGAGKRDGRDALYTLPWYTIIGPPAAGKTTALQRSGLKFPYVPGTGDRLKGVGGTRNCDWWLTNRGILLDTAGRWTTEDEDKDEWLAFLDLLKRHRGKRPLNGVIAAISVAGDGETSIAGVDEEGVKRLATRMRERLDEISGRLGLTLPVYVLFTKCDLIPGFVETFSDLSPAARGQVWGFTRSLSGSPGSPREVFASEFETLRGSLESYVMLRLNDEVSPASMPVIYEFPAQVNALKKKLELFVDELFEESAFGETPTMRGVYFTSGTQEGAPADLLLDQLAEGLQLRPAVHSAGETKNSYFVHDLLTKVVFEDRLLATASQRAASHETRRRRLITSGMFATAALLSLLPTLSCLENTKRHAHTSELVSQLRNDEAPAAAGIGMQRVPVLEALHGDIEHYTSNPNWLTGFGLYHGQTLVEPLEKLYAAALKEQIARPLYQRANARFITMAQQLKGARSQGAHLVPDERSRRELKNALKLHLLLTERRERCIPSVDTQRAWLTAQLVELWKRLSPDASADDLAARRRLIEDYLQRAGRADGSLLFGRDDTSIALIRPALLSDDEVERAYRAMLDRHAEESRSLTDLVGGSMLMQTPRTVQGAFTLEAWNELARSLSGNERWHTEEEDWVLGCDAARTADTRSAEQNEALQRKYLQELRTEWSEFLRSISVRTMAGMADAEPMLVELASRPGTLGRLFESVRANTSLPPPVKLQDTAIEVVKDLVEKKGKVRAAPEPKAPPADPALRELQRAFDEFAAFGAASDPGKETALEQYRRQVEAILLSLKAYRGDQSKLAELSNATRSAIDTTEVLLRNHTGSWNDVVRGLLLPPLESLSQMLIQERAKQIEQSFCDLVHRPFQEQLAGRYPFARESSESTTLQAFQSFFQPGTGAVWSFYESHLRGLVTQHGGRFAFDSARGTEARAMLREDIVHFLNRAQQIRRAFFPSDAAAPRMAFRVRVVGAPGYSVTTFRTGTTTVHYDSSGETWVPTEWPGEQASLGATLSVVPYEGVAPRPVTVAGEWGLFRLLDEQSGGYVLERGSRQITVGWKPKGGLHWIKVDFGTDDPHSPLLTVPLGGSSSLFPISVPAHIAHAGEGC